MATKLNLYANGEIVKSVDKNEEGKTNITIDGLTPNTNYSEGTYQVSYSKEGNESKKVNVPGFKTLPKPVESVSLDKASLSLTEGDSQKLNATVKPDNATNKNVTFETSNSAIATVDNSGNVTAIKSGDATITVKTSDGNKTANATVNVKAKVINVSSVNVEPKTVTLEIGETQQLTHTVSPSNATDKSVTFSSKSDSIASVDTNGLVTANSEGTTEVTVTTKDGSKTSVSTITVNKPVEPEPVEPEPEA